MFQVAYLPLDERPCNVQYPLELARLAGMTVNSPSIRILGQKKQPAEHTAIEQWLLGAAEDAEALIVSIDMLVYGGIVPSRLHHFTQEEALAKLQLLRELKAACPSLKIFGTNLIMRTPSYDSDDEEPSYYAQYGKLIYQYSWLQDKRTHHPLQTSEQADWDHVQKAIPTLVLEEHLNRRSVNAAVNEASIMLVQENVLDMLIIPLDDNAEFGFTASERNNLIALADSLNLNDRIHIYPGADEAGCTLMSRVFCDLHHFEPELYVRYSSTLGPSIIPSLEDRTLGESVKAHVTAAGGFIGDSASEADLILMVHSPANGQNAIAGGSTPVCERHRSYFSEINPREFTTALRRYLGKGKAVALADVATLNGSDHSLMQSLSTLGLLGSIHAYAGWNTSGNTLGTVIAHGIIESYYMRQPQADSEARGRYSREFYIQRLVEDWGYQSIARSQIHTAHLPAIGGTYFDISGQYDQVVELVRSMLTVFTSKYLKDLQPERIQLCDLRMPWKRMFEVGFHVRLESREEVAAE
ncbi:DUF4127 domain-containing protein [Paenibacillus lupini]|uniref:DUF4127 family protein n=1 Tax=Paenibacillus lupini TaxID=1450204 RepID=UPI00141F7ECD|nr:DUF4127 family protein [Paenibacillus lupini]NIK22034.1 hypothetical protein [Paenibacillus lupini]